MAVGSINPKMRRAGVVVGVIINDILDAGRTFENPAIARYNWRELPIDETRIAVIAAAERIIRR